MSIIDLNDRRSVTFGGPVLAELVTTHGGTAIEVRAVTDRLGPAAFDPDGRHLSRATYEALAPQIAAALDIMCR